MVFYGYFLNDFLGFGRTCFLVNGRSAYTDFVMIGEQWQVQQDDDKQNFDVKVSQAKIFFTFFPGVSLFSNISFKEKNVLLFSVIKIKDVHLKNVQAVMR